MAEEQRTSARSTKGVAPRRLGFEDEESATSPRTSFNRQTPSLASSRTSGSAPSVMEARCALLEARKRVAEAEADLASLNLERASRRSGTPKSSSPTMREEVFEEERRSEMQAPTAANGSDEVSVLYPAKSVQSGQTSDPDLIDLSADSVCDPRTVKSRSTSGRTVERLQGVGKNSVLVSDSVSTGTQRTEQVEQGTRASSHIPYSMAERADATPLALAPSPLQALQGSPEPVNLPEQSAVTAHNAQSQANENALSHAHRMIDCLQQSLQQSADESHEKDLVVQHLQSELRRTR